MKVREYDVNNVFLSTSKREVDEFFKTGDIFEETDEESGHQTENDIFNVLNKIPNKGISISNNHSELYN